MQVSRNQTVGEVVARNYKTADVFLSKGIDFCCGGNISIGQVCQNQGVDEEKLIRDLEAVLTEKDIESDLLNRLSPGALIDYIVDTHHTFVRENLITIPPYLEKLADVHGANHAELIKVNDLFAEIVVEMKDHMQKEEEILFPYIQNLEKGLSPKMVKYATLNEVLDVMHAEHDAAGTGMRTINELTDGYIVPADGCNTYRVALEKLKAFESDLHRHVHLENNILFSKALQLEKK